MQDRSIRYSISVKNPKVFNFFGRPVYKEEIDQLEDMLDESEICDDDDIIKIIKDIRRY